MTQMAAQAEKGALKVPVRLGPRGSSASRAGRRTPECSPTSLGGWQTGTRSSPTTREAIRAARSDGEPEDIPVALHAEDAAAILAAAGDGPASVYGNSGGGTIGLELVARQPRPRSNARRPRAAPHGAADAGQARCSMTSLRRAAGVFAAMGKFGAAVEEGGPKYSEEMQQSSQPPRMRRCSGDIGNFDLFIAHEIRPIAGYVPDVEALRNASTRIISAAGEASRASCPPCSRGARRAPDGAVTYLPGAHGGWGRSSGVRRQAARGSPAWASTRVRREPGFLFPPSGQEFAAEAGAIDKSARWNRHFPI